MTDTGKTAPDELPTRASLLSRLRDCGNEAAWREFFERYWRPIYHTALREGLSDTEAEDVVQEVIIHMTRKLPDFRYDPARSFKGWLLRTTRWKVMDQFRRRQRSGSAPPATEGDEGDSETIPAELEARWEAEWESSLKAAALHRLKQQVSAEHYQIFDLHVLKGRPVREVAVALGVALATVYVVKHRLVKLLRIAVAELRERPL